MCLGEESEVTGREILEQVVVLLGQVLEGDEAEELCRKLGEWLRSILGPRGR